MCETERQDADDVLLLNECLVTNDLVLCNQVPWAALLCESHLSGTCKMFHGVLSFVLLSTDSGIRWTGWGIRTSRYPRGNCH